MDELIERDEWASFLTAVTEKRSGATVAIEVLDPELGDEHEVRELPLSSISYDTSDAVLMVELSSTDDPNDIVLRHFINAPLSVAATPPTPGQVTAFKIESADGITLLEITSVNAHEDRGADASGPRDTA